jgi:hypothetical protein
MKHFIHTILFFIIFISCENKTDLEKYENLHYVSYNSNGELEMGTLDLTEYQNTYFGFSLSCPTNEWFILNKEQYALRLENNKEYLRASDQLWENSTSNFQNLLTIKKKLNSRKSNGSQSISFIAEGLEKIPRVNSALEYLLWNEDYSKEHYSANFPKFTITDLDNDLVGSRIFLVQSTTIEDGPNVRRFQKTYSAQFDKYLLNIISEYNTEAEQKENENILKQVKWD